MMMNRRLRENILIILSFAIALVLMVLPQPSWMAQAKPQWVFVVLLFWLMQAPNKIGPVVAWCVGLYVDLLMGDALGMHALVFVMFTYGVQRFLRMLQALPLWQQILMVGMASLLNVVMQLILMRLSGLFAFSMEMLLPAVANMIIWPWLYLICRDVRPRHDFRLMHTGR